MPDSVHVALINQIGELYEQNPQSSRLVMDMLRTACRLGAAHEFRELAQSFHTMKGFGSLKMTKFNVIGSLLEKRADVLDREGVTKQS